METTQGKLRFLVAEDEKPLSADEGGAERGRLAGIAADPEGFAKKEQALKNDESHSRQMLVAAAEGVSVQRGAGGGWISADRTTGRTRTTRRRVWKEKVLHGMSGTMLIEPKEMRLHEIDGRSWRRM